MLAPLHHPDPPRPDPDPLVVREIRPRDRDALAAAFERLSPESRRRRFLGPKPVITARELTRFTEVDHVGHEAVVAIDEASGAIVGVARYAAHADRRDAAEIAFVVADEWQGRGIGARLAGDAVRRARANGMRHLTAETYWENRPARALLRRLGFQACGSAGAVLALGLDL